MSVSSIRAFANASTIISVKSGKGRAKSVNASHRSWICEVSGGTDFQALRGGGIYCIVIGRNGVQRTSGNTQTSDVVDVKVVWTGCLTSSCRINCVVVGRASLNASESCVISIKRWIYWAFLNTGLSRGVSEMIKSRTPWTSNIAKISTINTKSVLALRALGNALSRIIISVYIRRSTVCLR
jgi:hypothetical protein